MKCVLVGLRILWDNGRMTPRVAGTALLALGIACAGPRRIRIRPSESRDLRGVVFMPFASSRTEAFSDPEGRPCPGFSGEIRDFFAGWQSRSEDPACDHDTYDDSTREGALELRWHGTVPADGAWDVISGGYSVGAWGRVRVRGSYYGNFFAIARLVLDARTPHCRAEWSSDLATAKITGTIPRGAEFSGWVAIPDTRIAGCRKDDPLDVRLRLVADSNRGRIEVDAFGFSVAEAGELNTMFGIKPAEIPAAPAAHSIASPWIPVGVQSALNHLSCDRDWTERLRRSGCRSRDWPRSSAASAFCFPLFCFPRICLRLWLCFLA